MRTLVEKSTYCSIQRVGNLVYGKESHMRWTFVGADIDNALAQSVSVGSCEQLSHLPEPREPFKRDTAYHVLVSRSLTLPFAPP